MPGGFAAAGKSGLIGTWNGRPNAELWGQRTVAEGTPGGFSPLAERK